MTTTTATTTSLRIARFAGLLGAMGVGAGAYGAHALEAGWQERGLLSFDKDDDADDAITLQRWHKVWQNGWVMNMTGSAATLGIAALPINKNNNMSPRTRVPIAILIGGGTAVFSLAAYASAYYHERKYSFPAAPLGGSAVILGWLVLALAP